MELPDLESIFRLYPLSCTMNYLKTTFVLLILSITISTCYGQEANIGNNEVGVDATPLIQNVLSLGNHPTAAQEPQPYFLIYRRHLENWAFRGGIGGHVWRESVTENDTTTTQNESGSISYRVGIERKSNISERWQVFYGFDFRVNRNTTSNSILFSNGVMHESVTTEGTESGIAPFLGFRFRINDKLSLTSETSFFYYAFKDKVSRFYEDESLNSVVFHEGIESAYQAPLSLFFNIRF